MEGAAAAAATVEAVRDAIELQIRVFHTKQYDMRLKVILTVSGINLVEFDRVSA